MHNIEAELFEACVLVALLVLNLAVHDRHTLINPGSECRAFAACTARGKASQVIRHMRLQPPEAFIFDDEADSVEGGISGCGELSDRRYRHIQPADEAVERRLKLVVR